MLEFDLIDDAPDLRRPPPALHAGPCRGQETDRSHECDECGDFKPDVDLWAEHPETGEEIWLCVSCGEW